jgi:SWI/SNF-related matrix-associated actin-dependent regulator 1 of chromatin subfamily A
MGVGKTVQAIAVASIYRVEWPMLIIAPSFLKYVWRTEMLRWLRPSIGPGDIQIVQTSKDHWNINAAVYIISYDLATKKEDEIQKLKFKVCIADEAHYLKSGTTKRTKALLPILSQAQRCILITGTPILSRPCELFNILKCLRPDIIHSF